jgi:hypothetical protein
MSVFDLFSGFGFFRFANTGHFALFCCRIFTAGRYKSLFSFGAGIRLYSQDAV